MVGESCYDGGGCQRSDMIFPLTDDPLVTGAAPVAAPATSAAPPTSIGADLLSIIAIGVAFAVAGASAAVVIARRRVVTAPAGR
jgi:hypothetical protein